MNPDMKPFPHKHWKLGQSETDSEVFWCKEATETASANMEKFITQVRKQSWFLQKDGGPKWEDLIWRLDRNRKFGRKVCYSFTTRPRSDDPLPEPFAQQSRAIVAQMFLWKKGNRPETAGVLQLIFHAMESSGQPPDLIRLNQHAIDMLNEAISERYNAGSRYGAGRQLEIVVNDILSGKLLTETPVSYGSPFKSASRPNSFKRIARSELTEMERLEAKPSKLPDFQAVLALAKLFHEPGDRFRNQNLVISAFGALAFFGPSRVSEILSLPVDCIRTADEKGGQILGLHWRPVKSGEPMTKFAVTSEWEDLARETVRRLTVLGSSARTAAAWYESNPNRLYLPPYMEHLRGKPLTLREVAMIIGYEPGNGPGFLTAHSMLDALELADPGHNAGGTEYSQESVKALVKLHIKEYPCYLTSRLVQVADWLEQENSDLVVDGNVLAISGKPLTAAQALAIVGLSEKDLECPQSLRKIAVNLKHVSARADCLSQYDSKVRSKNSYEFASLENWVMKRLRKDMHVVDPQTGLKLSQALFCLPKNIMNPIKTTLWNIPYWISAGCIRSNLSDYGNQPSIFALNGITDKQTGKPLEMKTHAPRHLLDTLGHKNCIADQLKAFWAGRKDPSQNPAYNHLTQEYLIENFQSLEHHGIGDVKVLGTILDTEAESSQEVVTFEQVKQMGLGPVQISAFGICKHRFETSPCPYEMDCLNCTENMFVAHNPVMINHAREQIESLQESLNKSNEADAGQWSRMHADKLPRWEKALELMTDENTPSGRTVSLPPNPNAKTMVEFAMNANESIGNPDANVNWPNQSGSRTQSKTTEKTNDQKLKQERY